MYNLEKNLIFISDVQFVDELLVSCKALKERSSEVSDVNKVIRKLKNIRELCQEKTKS
jgi:hypothetical protein